MTSEIMTLAERLASAGKTYLSDAALAGYARRFKVDPDDGRRAGIIADRLRRRRQIEEGRNTFSATPLPIDAPIELLARDDRRRGKA